MLQQLLLPLFSTTTILASTIPSQLLTRRQGSNETQSPCNPGDELACCAAENDDRPIVGAACELNIRMQDRRSSWVVYADAVRQWGRIALMLIFSAVVWSRM